MFTLPSMRSASILFLFLWHPGISLAAFDPLVPSTENADAGVRFVAWNRERSAWTAGTWTCFPVRLPCS